MLVAVGAVLVLASTAHAAPPPAAPSRTFGGLYAEVERRSLFADSKTFADAIPREPPAVILKAWRAGGPWSDTALKAFVTAHFTLPIAAAAPAPASTLAAPHHDLLGHIRSLWPVLTRRTVDVPADGSALSVPEPYVVPGGRFRELYYWDSYFTMLGLARDGRGDLVRAMIGDFGALIDRYGHIPNGTRNYYLSRSQPPVFYLMLGLAPARDPATRRKRLHWLRREYAWWMTGERGLRPGQARAHVVALPDGAVVNRYFDALSTPRDESFREDDALARAGGRPKAELWANLRAGAESGWDYSSRWLEDGRTLASIRTTALAPVDLNSLLFGLERVIAKGCGEARDLVCALDFARRADRRAQALSHWFWDADAGVYRDVLWRTGARTASESAATLYPLFTGAAPAEQAHRVAAAVQRDLLAPGGIRTTAVTTGQQWDRPNGWAPLQWIAAEGLRRYGETVLADEVACRWRATVAREYVASGRLLEKYDVDEARPGGGGEYPLQDGFGWTNGVVRALADIRCPSPLP